MARIRSRRDNSEIWPGFVDALSTLLMVIMFLLVVFMLGQFLLSRALEGRDQTVSSLEQNLANYERRLLSEQEAVRDLQIEMAELTENIADLRQERDRLTSERDAARSNADDLDNQLAQALERASQLEIDLAGRDLDLTQQQELAASLAAELAAARETFSAERETVETQLAELTRLRLEIGVLNETRDQLDSDLAELQAELEAGRLEQQQLETALGEADSGRDTAVGQVQILSRQIATLSNQLLSLEGALGEKQAEIDSQNVVIADLGVRLNDALADKVEELSQFRSDFFGKLRTVLGARDEVQIVGDRFVFQSEVLFDSGAAQIGAAGQSQLAQLADILIDLASEIPDELPWVVQVDGHTDKRPITGGRYPSNWELSTARAISVARYLIDRGLPAERVAARGFAEFQPIDNGDDEAALRRNRRIEIKLTTR